MEILSRILENRINTYLIIAVLALLAGIISVASIRISQMNTGDFFVISIIPLQFWIAVPLITCITFLALHRIKDYNKTLIFLSFPLMTIISFRMAFPIMFTSIAGYEQDASTYLTVVNNWVNTGINFGLAGHYEHDYPLSFLISYFFVKLGVPLDAFFRVAPFVIYSVIALMLFFIVRELVPSNGKIAATSVFLFSFSSLGYWVTVHYCPDLLGAMFFMIALYVSIRFAMRGVWSFKTIAPVCVILSLLVLSHHLSALYLILTLMGLALSTWFFDPPQIKGKALSFFILGIFTYTFWFVYGTLIYPAFFNVYSYFGGGYGSPTGLVQQAGFFVNITFWVYPFFIILLFSLQFLKSFQIKKVSDFFHIIQKIKQTRIRESSNMPLVFTTGFLLVLGLFFIGFAAPVSFPTRVIEVLCMGAYPLSSQMFLRIGDGKLSKKKLLLIILVLTILVIIGIYRYYSQMQRRVIIS